MACRRGPRGRRDASDVRRGGGGGEFIRHHCNAPVFGAASETSSKSAAGGGHDSAGGSGHHYAGVHAGGGRFLRQRGGRCAWRGSAPLSFLPHGGCRGRGGKGIRQGRQGSHGGVVFVRGVACDVLDGDALGQPPAHVRDVSWPTHLSAPSGRVDRLGGQGLARRGKGGVTGAPQTAGMLWGHRGCRSWAAESG